MAGEARRGPLDGFDLGEVRPGRRERLALTLDAGEGLTAELPAVAVAGASPGPTLVAVAGVHGDEYEGMEAIRLVAARLDAAAMAGRFLGILVANPWAYAARTRATPPEVDGLNLARVFPGDPGGRPTERLAAALLALVLRTVEPEDLLVDFHSGSADVPFAPLVGVREVPGAARGRAEAAARRFGLPRLWAIPDLPGPLNAETARLGIPTIGTETTGRAGCAPGDVEGFRRGLANLLVHLGMVEGEAPPAVVGPFRRTVDAVSPADGFLRSENLVGARVAEGDPLGTVVSMFGDEVAELAAPASGELWAARSMPAVRAGELVAMIAIDLEG